jgi:hypothetical protein
VGGAADQGIEHAERNIFLVGQAPRLGAQLVVCQGHQAIEIAVPKLLDRGVTVGSQRIEQMGYGIHGARWGKITVLNRQELRWCRKLYRIVTAG